MAVKEPPPRSFWTKNLGARDRMLWSLLGLALMTVGFEAFHAISEKGIGPGILTATLGFLIFLQAPMAWSLPNALKRKSTFERDHLPE